MQTVMIHMGLLAFVVLSKSLKETAVLNFVGQNTITIFALHMIVQSILRGVLFKVLHVTPDGIESSFVWSVLLTLVTLAALVPVIRVINRFVPWLAGKKVKS